MAFAASAGPRAGVTPARRHLLVVTDQERSGRDGLALPFDDATVVDLEANQAIAVASEFDCAVIDCQPMDGPQLDLVATTLVRAIRPDGYLFVVLPVIDRPISPSAAEPPSLAGLQWHGVEALNGVPCAVLRPLALPGHSESATLPAGLLLTTADTASRLAGNHATHKSAKCVPGAATRVIEDRTRSDRVPPGPTDNVVHELHEHRRRHRWRAVASLLKRRRAGRALLSVIRPAHRRTARLVSRASRRRG